MIDNTSVSPVIITGVGKRLGLALANYFLAQHIPVVGTYRSKYPVLDQLSERGADLYYCDFYDLTSVEVFIQRIVEKYSRARALVHNASDWLSESAGADRAEIMQKMLQVHVSVPYRLNVAFEPLLRSGAIGQMSDIIHFTDYVADKGSKKHIAYAASKAALANLTLSFAAAFAPAIKVNSIAPALILFNEGDTDAYKEKSLKKALIQHEGGLQEVIAAVQYLFNSHYVTGRTLHLDGGRHLV
jgi:dihydromonapterin reductase/dihydrofolate reductase